MKPSQLRATAFHEAGHVIAADAAKLRISTVTIVADSDSAGHTRHDNPLRGIHLDYDGSDRARLRGERAIMVCFAGAAAQKKHSARSWRNFHGEADRRLAIDIATQLNGSTKMIEAHLNWLLIRTNALIERRWGDVEAVAEALLAERTLKKDQIVEILSAQRLKKLQRRGAPAFRLIGAA